MVDIKGLNSYIVRVQGNKHRFVHADHMIHDDSSPRQVMGRNPERPPPSITSVPDSASPWVDQNDQTQDHTCLQVWEKALLTWALLELGPLGREG